MSQTKPLSPDSQAIFDIAKSANDAYLVAYRTGYEAGFSAALLQATKMVKGSMTDGATKGEQK